MSVLEEAKKHWKELFEKFRLKYVTTQRVKLIDLLLKGELTSLYWLSDNREYDDWCVLISYEGAIYRFENYEDGDFKDLSGLFDNSGDDDGELYEFYDFLSELDVENYIEKLEDEKLMNRFERSKQKHLNLKIVHIEKKYEQIYYHLENGDVILVKP